MSPESELCASQTNAGNGLHTKLVSATPSVVCALVRHCVVSATPSVACALMDQETLHFLLGTVMSVDKERG